MRGLIYVFGVHDFEHLQQLHFIFSNTEGEASFKCGKDASTLEVTKKPVKESNMGEYGREVVVDVSNTKNFFNYIGRCLLKTYSIFSLVENSYIGIKLVFESGLILIVIKVDGEINISESLSSSFEHDQGIKSYKWLIPIIEPWFLLLSLRYRSYSQLSALNGVGNRRIDRKPSHSSSRMYYRLGLGQQL